MKTFLKASIPLNKKAESRKEQKHGAIIDSFLVL